MQVAQQRAAPGARPLQRSGAATRRAPLVRCAGGQQPAAALRSSGSSGSSGDAPAGAGSSSGSTSRRALLGVGLGALAAAAAPRAADAAAAAGGKAPPREGGVAVEDSPFIQELLRRTEEKREERKAERLKDYYKRNFRDYMAFDAGDEATARARGISPETGAAMRKWLEDNADEAMPGLRKKD